MNLGGSFTGTFWNKCT